MDKEQHHISYISASLTVQILFYRNHRLYSLKTKWIQYFLVSLRFVFCIHGVFCMKHTEQLHIFCTVSVLFLGIPFHNNHRREYSLFPSQFSPPKIFDIIYSTPRNTFSSLSILPETKETTSPYPRITIRTSVVSPSDIETSIPTCPFFVYAV